MTTPQATGSFRSRIPIVPRWLRGWVVPAAALFFWWAAFRFGWTHATLFVSPGTVLEAGLRLVRAGQLWPAIGASLSRMAAGFAIGTVAGLSVGTAFGISRPLDRLIAPTFHAIKQVSVFAWIPMIAFWFGLGESPKIAVLAWAAFFPVMLNTYQGVRSVSHEHLEAARAFAFTRGQILRHVILPSALPSVFTGISLALIYAWLATLGAEYLLTSGLGLGTLLVEGREHAWMDQVLFGMVVIGAVGLSLNFLAGRLEARFLRWREGSLGRY